MARIAYFQPFSGISGDMTLGALVDAGLDFSELERALRSLGLRGYRLRVGKVHRGALESTRFEVLLDAVEPPSSRADSGPHSHSHDHGSEDASATHSHSHSRTHTHEPGAHSRGHSHTHAGQGDAPPERRLRHILELIRTSKVPERVKEMASAVFRRLGEAEARVHGMGVENVHFHEVGAVDSIVDIVGSCLALHLLDIEEVHSAPVHVGSGWVTGSHGRLPLPAPATLELLKGFPVRQLASDAELTTPTGAALLTTLSRSFGPLPASRITAIGYGAGDDRPGPVPNCLRVILAERSTCAPETDSVILLETNIDDMSPEWTGHLVDRLLEAGALDVYLTPVLMKKTRSAQQVTVICPREREEVVSKTLFRESTTFGVRRNEVDRLVLSRESRKVTTPWGEVRVKVGRRSGELMTAAPEFEDLRRAAMKAGLPLKEVHQRVMEAFRSG